MIGIKYSIEQQKIKIVKERKIKQYAPLVIANGRTIWGTEKSRDNLFKAYSICKEDATGSYDWLDIDGEPLTLSLAEAHTIRKQFMDRDTMLYFEEALAIKALS